MDQSVQRGTFVRALRAFVLRQRPALFARVFEPDSAELGLLGEEYVARRLRSCDWTILARRLRTKAGEVDLLAREGQQLACIEIKTARTSPLPLPRELASERERFEVPAGLAARLERGQFARLARAARLIAREHGLSRTERVRIDLVLVLFDTRTRRLSLTHTRGLGAAPVRARIPTNRKKWSGRAPEGVSPED